MMAFIGKRYVLRYVSGMTIRAEYRSEREVAWEALAGPATGSAGTEATEASEVAPGTIEEA